jgi:hypothetical protein
MFISILFFILISCGTYYGHDIWVYWRGYSLHGPGFLSRRGQGGIFPVHLDLLCESLFTLALFPWIKREGVKLTNTFIECLD